MIVGGVVLVITALLFLSAAPNSCHSRSIMRNPSLKSGWSPTPTTSLMDVRPERITLPLGAQRAPRQARWMLTSPPEESLPHLRNHGLRSCLTLVKLPVETPASPAMSFRTSRCSWFVNFDEGLGWPVDPVGRRRSLQYDSRPRANHSGDSLDVLFFDSNRRIAVEVKGASAPVGEVIRGLFQCVKYEAVLDAEARPGLITASHGQTVCTERTGGTGRAPG